MKDVMPPERWPSVETDLIDLYSLKRNKKGKGYADKWALKEAQYFVEYARRISRAKSIRTGIEVGSKSLAQMFFGGYFWN